MQISESEVTKVLTSDTGGLLKNGEVDMKFKEVPQEALPKTKEPDPAEVARVLQLVKEAPDVREDIVMKLKEKIDKGEYKTSGDQIADMMIRRMKADRVR